MKGLHHPLTKNLIKYTSKSRDLFIENIKQFSMVLPDFPSEHFDNDLVNDFLLGYFGL